jgi:diaminopimelate epimerase
MRKIKFTKMVASGNDFIVVRPFARSPVRPLQSLAQKICDRKFGVGADGLLVLGKSRIADVRMRIFNADGSEAEMCGNGARCVASLANSKLKTPNSQLKIETKAGIIKSVVAGGNVKIKLTDPKDLKLDISIPAYNRTLRVNFINTGVPHVVIFVEGLEKIDVLNLGRQIRFHKAFAPRGTNVNFVETLSDDSIKIRTYERGVEDETLACGTGSTASALIFALKTKAGNKIKVHTKSKEVLNVYFKRLKNKFVDVWLGGKARIVFKGEYL